MRKLNNFLAVLILFLSVPASITWAQTITSVKGLTTVEFNLPQGKIKVYLPDDIRPGDVISGSIVAESFGDKPKMVSKNIAELNKVSVGIGTKRYSPAGNTTRIFSEKMNTIPEGVQIYSGHGQLLFDTRLTEPGTISPEKKNGLPVVPFCIPSHCITGSPFRIKNSFDGDASTTKVIVGVKEAVILAESPGECIASFPVEANGLMRVIVMENAAIKCSGSISAVSLDLIAAKTRLKKGENTTVSVIVSGLENLPDTAKLTISNMTPAIITMQPGNYVPVLLDPGSVKSGTYNRRFTVQSIKTGDFSISADLDLPEAYYDVKKLDKPRRLENEALHTGLSQAIKKLEADAGGAAGKEYNEVCESCQKCIRALAGKWAEDLVRKLGEEMIKEFLGKALDMIAEGSEILSEIKELVDDADEKLEKAEDIMKELEEEIKAGELQLLVFNDKLCESNKNCVVSAIVFYDPATGCVLAFVKCNGRVPDCCPNAFTTVKISYCTDERGMPKDMPKTEVIKK